MDTYSLWSGEQITVANPIDTNVNDKSPKFQYYEFLWLSIISKTNTSLRERKEKKRYPYLQEQICSFPKRPILIWLDRKEPFFLHFTSVNRNYPFSSIFDFLRCRSICFYFLSFYAVFILSICGKCLFFFLHYIYHYFMFSMHSFIFIFLPLSSI